MKNKKTTYIWVLILLEILNLPNLLKGIFNYPSAEEGVGISYVWYSLSVLSLVFALIWLYQAILLKKHIILWTHILLGFGIFSQIVSVLIVYLTDKTIFELTLTTNLIGAIVVVIIWITFVKHLKNALSTNRIQLN